MIFLPTAHIPLVSPSPNEPTPSSQHAKTNSTSVSDDPSISLNTKFPNSQNVTSSSPLSNVEPNFFTNEHSNIVSNLNRNPSEPSCTSSSQSHAISSPCSSIPVLPSQNVHPMQTRSKFGIHQPRLHPSLFLAHCEPKTDKQALADHQWFVAMKQEYEALVNNKTWDLVPLPKDKQVGGCKWVFKIKENVDRTFSRFKARLEAKGFHEVVGCDFNETFSLMIKPATIRMIIILALTNKWDLFQLDVNNAFLNCHHERDCLHAATTRLRKFR